jgi:hypothetical protein
MKVLDANQTELGGLASVARHHGERLTHAGDTARSQAGRIRVSEGWSHGWPLAMQRLVESCLPDFQSRRSFPSGQPLCHQCASAAELLFRDHGIAPPCRPRAPAASNSASAPRIRKISLVVERACKPGRSPPSTAPLRCRGPALPPGRIEAPNRLSRSLDDETGLGCPRNQSVGVFQVHETVPWMMQIYLQDRANLPGG